MIGGPGRKNGPPEPQLRIMNIEQGTPNVEVLGSPRRGQQGNEDNSTDVPLGHREDNGFRGYFVIRHSLINIQYSQLSARRRSLCHSQRVRTTLGTCTGSSSHRGSGGISAVRPALIPSRNGLMP